ncbi:MAG: hypothetical protein JWM36_9 [Hyphomicrobiales bacterium]|nr:hypothetical protein [Hyphomicrobiales bacterium]
MVAPIVVDQSDDPLPRLRQAAQHADIVPGHARRADHDDILAGLARSPRAGVISAITLSHQRAASDQ